MNSQPRRLASGVDLEQVREWVMEAGRMALSHCQQTRVRFKEDGTPATSAEREIESYLVARISERYPDHHIVGEEGGVRAGDADFVWAIDPIDGTRAYVSGLPVWGISVGVLHEGRPLAGVFYMPAVNQEFWGEVGCAFYNGELISPHFLQLEDPFAFLAVPSNAHRMYEIDFPRVRSLGSTAAHLAYVAQGVAIGALTRRVRIWDLAGVMPILSWTGASLVCLSGAPLDLLSLVDGGPAPEPLIAAHPRVIDQIRDGIRCRVA